MAITAASLKEFYQTPIGRKLARACMAAFLRYPAPIKSDFVMGYGYTFPYLNRFAENTRHRLAFMPAEMAGPSAETENKHNIPKQQKGKAASLPDKKQKTEKTTLLAAERRFPLEDKSIDCILAIHALEFSPDTESQLAELWRILTPNGRLILAVANRRSLWTHAEQMPFAHGQPYSRHQLGKLLNQTAFEFKEIYEICHILPNKKHRLSFFSRLYGKAAKYFFPYFGAVLVVEAHKKLYKPIIQPNRTPRSVFLPGFTPQPTARLPKSSSSSL